MRRLLAVSVFALVSTAGLHAQAVLASGAITGIVKDIYGDGVPETTILLSNKAIGFRRVMQTSDEGIFELPGLIPAGSYDLKVTRRGYADWELPNFDVSVGDTLNFKITIYADRTATPEEAQRAIPAVQDSKTELSTLIDDQQIYNLPTQNLQLDPLALLGPAVVEAPIGTLIFRGEPFRNSFYFDGIDITNYYFANRPGIAPFVTQESSSEMQVIASSALAEFGHTAGGIFNMVTKTGVNGLHAAAYDYYDRNSWNSPDFFANGFVPTGRENHAGISLGVPISTDELFFYGNLERVNNDSQGLNRIDNPLLTTNNGNAVNTPLCTATAVQCATAAAFLTNEMNVKVPQSQIGTIGFARLDFRPGEHNSFTLASSIDSQRAPNSFDNASVDPSGGLLGYNATTTDSTRYASFGWTRTFGGLEVNEFHGDWYRNTLAASTDPTLYPSSSSACGAACGTGPIAISVAGTQVGGNPAIPYNVREQRYGINDIFTRLEGRHTIRGGADVWRSQDTTDQLYASYGMYNYSTLTAFAEDLAFNTKQSKDYATFSQTLGSTDTDLFSYQFNAFVQDTWKALPKLTVTGGVRWEKARYPTPPPSNNFQSLSIPSANTDFSPRIGIAYMLDSRTVIRVGGGSFYEPFPGQFIRDLWMGGGAFQSFYMLTPNEVGAPAFPKSLPANAVNTLNSALLTEFYPATKFRNPYVTAGNASIERRVNRYIDVVASYVQSSGKRLLTASDVDVEGSTSTSETYNINNAAGTAVNTFTTPVYYGATAGQRWQVDNEGGSRYRALTSQFRTAPIFGLSLQASYTWSHSVDDLSGPTAFSVVPSNLNPGNYEGDIGPSAFDQRSRVAVNLIWQPVFSKGKDAVSRFVLNGWRVAAIGTYASSMHVTPVIEVQGQQFPKTSTNTGINMDYPVTLNGGDGWNRVPWEGVNTLPVGTLFNLDARASKTIPFTERLKGQFIAEAFNVTNRENVTAVSNIAYTAVLGNINPVAGLGMPIGSYGYPFGSGARRLQLGFRLEF